MIEPPLPRYRRRATWRSSEFSFGVFTSRSPEGFSSRRAFSSPCRGSGRCSRRSHMVIASKEPLPNGASSSLPAEDLAPGSLTGLGRRESGHLHPAAMPALRLRDAQEAARGAADVQQRSASRRPWASMRARPARKSATCGALLTAPVHHAVVKEVPLPLGEVVLRVERLRLGVLLLGREKNSSCRICTAGSPRCRSAGTRRSRTSRRSCSSFGDAVPTPGTLPRFRATQASAVFRGTVSPSSSGRASLPQGGGNVRGGRRGGDHSVRTIRLTSQGLGNRFRFPGHRDWRGSGVPVLVPSRGSSHQ